MACSFPFLNELGYEGVCEVHDVAYEYGLTIKDKIKADFEIAHNMMRVRKWHSPFIAMTALIILTVWPDAYIRFYKKD